MSIARMDYFPTRQDRSTMETPFRPLPHLSEKFFVDSSNISESDISSSSSTALLQNQNQQQQPRYLRLPDEYSLHQEESNGGYSNDLPTTQTGIRAEELRRFADVCSWAIDHVYFGGEGVARRLELMKEKGITHVVNCVRLEHRNYFENDLKYLTLYLQDSVCENITAVLYDVFDFLEEARDLGGRVFVHCSQGVSRSAALVIAYVMWTKKLSFDETREAMRKRREVVDPNFNFLTQLYKLEQKILKKQDKFLRIYRIKAQSKHQPSYLVPQLSLESNDKKEIDYNNTTSNNNLRAPFDPRGAFIVHTQDQLYIWIGKKCLVQYLETSRHFTKQLQKYEGAFSSVTEIFEGEETKEFRATLAYYLHPSMNEMISEEHEDFTVDYDRFDHNLHHSLSAIPWKTLLDVDVPLSTRRARSDPLLE